MTTPYAIPRSTPTLGFMATMGEFIKDKRGHMSQKALSEASGVDRAYIAQIESGRIPLPGADIRRRLASALASTNIEMLVAAGEITREEVEAIANPGEVPFDVRASLDAGLLGRVWEWARDHPEREQFLLQLMGNLKE